MKAPPRTATVAWDTTADCIPGAPERGEEPAA